MMTTVKKYCWVVLFPLLAVIYWKKAKDHPVGPLPGSSYIKDSILVHTHDEFKTFVAK
jgi:hypothetical protein